MLEEYGKYETISGKKVHLEWTLPFEKMVRWYWREILEILWKTKIERDEWEESLKEQEVIVGLTNDLMMPSSHRHRQSGKCLWGNGPSITGEKLENYLKTFDIETK